MKANEENFVKKYKKNRDKHKATKNWGKYKLFNLWGAK